MKLAGATYMDIHKAGGGIHFTVRHTRAASEDELKELAMKRFDRMLAQGTTLVEGKSGYGLECETEMKMLKVLCACNKAHSIDIVSNYLGAHSIPSGLTEEQAVKDIVEVQLPSLQKLKDQHLVDVEQIDVFHEQGVFGTEATRRILEEGKRYGLGINFHGDELHAMGSAELAAELGAQAVSHVECISEAGISALAKSQCVAVVLPTTFYILRLHPPPVRRMIEAGVPVALASDFNPNAHCMSMPFVMNLACVMTRMSMPEALVAATINSAAALGRSADYGSIEVDKWADMVIVGSSRWEHLVYELADPPIAFVVKKGSIVHEKK
jgi:imidazolonepropionase